MLRLNNSSLGCQAQEPCERPIPLLPKHLATDEPMLRVLVARWQEQLWHGNLEQLEIHGQYLLANAQIRGFPEVVMYTRILMAEVWRCQGRLEPAQQLLLQLRETLLRHRPGLTELFQMILLGLGKIAYEQHDLTTLRYTVEQMQHMSAGGCTCHDWIRRNFLSGLLDMAEGRYGAAGGWFRRLAEGPLSMYDRLSAKLAILESMALQREGHSVMARELMQNLSDHIDRGQCEGVFINHRGMFPNALAIADALHYTTRTHLTNIIQFPTTKLSLNEPPLFIETFGPGRLLIDHQETPLEMPLERIVVAFLALHPLGVDAETLRRDLWPESASHESISRFVRKLADKLGKIGEQDIIVREKGVYQFGADFQCDAAQHDRLYDRALTLMWGPERYPALRAASTLHQAPFLQGITRHLWVEEQRTLYERHQGLIYYQMAGLCYLDQDPLQAMDYLDKALNANPIFDPAVDDYLRMLEWADRHSEALRTYRLYEARTQKLFGCPPSQALQTLIGRIRAGSVKVSGAFSEGALARAGITVRRTMPQLAAANEQQQQAIERFFTPAH